MAVGSVGTRRENRDRLDRPGAEALHGNLLVGVWKDSLIARIGPDAYDDALLEPHVKEFDITGRAMKGWVLVGPEEVEDDPLREWVRRAEAFVGTLPRK